MRWLALLAFLGTAHADESPAEKQLRQENERLRAENQALRYFVKLAKAKCRRVSESEQNARRERQESVKATPSDVNGNQ